MQPQETDTIYQSYGKNLYKLTGNESSDAMNNLLPDPNANNSMSVAYPADMIGSGVDTSITISATGSYQAGKKTFDNTASGFIMGVDPKDGLAKLYIGNTTSYFNWDGATLTVKGSISATSIDIPDTITTNSFHVDNTGNSWWGATTLAASTANVTSAGVATFAGLSVINKKAFTNFESSGRFVSTTGGSGSNVFGNQGVTISPGATGTSYSKMLWRIGNVFSNSPTFTCTLLALTIGSSDARGFIGLGQPTVDGTGIVYSGNSQIGFRVDKTGGTCTIASETNDGGAGTSQGATLLTIVDNDVVELFIKATPTKVKWYYRKNGGTLTLGDTQTTHIPVGTGEDTVLFATSNIGNAVDYKLILQCAAYEH